MAQAITNIQTAPPEMEFFHTQDAAKKSMDQFVDAMAANAEALQEFVKCISLLHARGILPIVNALLDQGEGVMKILVDQAQQPQYATGIKNSIALLEILGSLDVSTIHTMLQAMTQVAEDTKKEEVHPMTIFRLLGSLKDPDIAAGLSYMLEVVKALGKDLRTRS
ncbi:DUF1641 domain-containing protein [Fodinisporobacter ferrooxydans]|uniref:DUF1641 domain-containing protein n=1 Tax=Fodinisporobacter ferrooxydans TaxID=2901836 RepID=A0ABY4CQY8_9BACL|nr:DUF1641 domain-containing protein [Alicyclobacillaceae bacterium MYW30-H2]